MLSILQSKEYTVKIVLGVDGAAGHVTTSRYVRFLFASQCFHKIGIYKVLKSYRTTLLVSFLI